MRKKILFSFLAIAVSAAIVIGGTTAFFSDTETSAGNVFTDGSIDLKIDHTKQTYNGVDCQTCSLKLYSGDGGAQVVDGVNTVLTSFPFPAVLVTPTAITQQYWTTHPTAEWIWASASTLVGDDGTNGNVTYTFEHKFNWWGGAVDVDLQMNVAADNQYQIFLNGNPIASGLGSAEYTTLDPIAEGVFLAAVVPGENTLKFIVTNLTQQNPVYNTPLNNPGGLLYYLNVMRNSEDCNANSEFLKNCRLWEDKDLETGDVLFSFDDVKPGDHGTNVISLHVYDNDAYACMYTENDTDFDNGCTEPEGDVDGTCGNPGPGDGELSKYLNVFAWRDLNGDGIYQPSTETVLAAPNTYKNIFILGNGLAYADSLTGGNVLAATTTAYIGFTWCAGTLTVDGNGNFACDPISMGNITQTDSLVADVVFYAEQVRNNAGFTCNGLFVPPVMP
jgi:predicted ribosomally synthesized peptide with SipW-like signal peptide